MTTKKFELIVEAETQKATDGLKKLDKTLDEVTRSTDKAGDQVSKLDRKMDESSSSTKKMSAGLNKVERSAKEAGSAFSRLSARAGQAAMSMQTKISSATGTGSAAFGGLTAVAGGYAAAIAGGFWALDAMTDKVVEASNVFANLRGSLDSANKAIDYQASSLDVAKAKSVLLTAGVIETDAQFAKFAGNAAKLADAHGIALPAALAKMSKAVVKGNVDSMRAFGITTDNAIALEELRKQYGFASAAEIPAYLKQQLAMNELMKAGTESANKTKQANFGLAHSFQALKNQSLDALLQFSIDVSDMPMHISELATSIEGLAFDGFESLGMSAEGAGNTIKGIEVTFRAVMGVMTIGLSEVVFHFDDVTAAANRTIQTLKTAAGITSTAVSGIGQDTKEAFRAAIEGQKAQNEKTKEAVKEAKLLAEQKQFVVDMENKLNNFMTDRKLRVESEEKEAAAAKKKAEAQAKSGAASARANSAAEMALKNQREMQELDRRELHGMELINEQEKLRVQQLQNQLEVATKRAEQIKITGQIEAAQHNAEMSRAAERERVAQEEQAQREAANAYAYAQMDEQLTVMRDNFAERRDIELENDLMLLEAKEAEGIMTPMEALEAEHNMRLELLDERLADTSGIERDRLEAQVFAENHKMRMAQIAESNAKAAQQKAVMKSVGTNVANITGQVSMAAITAAQKGEESIGKVVGAMATGLSKQMGMRAIVEAVEAIAAAARYDFASAAQHGIAAGMAATGAIVLGGAGAALSGSSSRKVSRDAGPGPELGSGGQGSSGAAGGAPPSGDGADIIPISRGGLVSSSSVVQSQGGASKAEATMVISPTYKTLTSAERDELGIELNRLASETESRVGT